MRGGVCLGAIATNRGEHIDSMWLVLAAACSYLLGYRFYAKFIAARVPTDKWIVFGHHFAAIAGPAPLVGPVLAATSRERCDGKLPGQMTRVEIGKVGGLVALVTVLLIMIVLLAVVGLVVVNALVGSPWGVIGMLAIGILIVRPELQMPSLTRFVDGNGPVFAGKIFPFCFITIACGAVSGFHALIASGTTPGMMARESNARPIGYGAMIFESCVAIMAMIAACATDPGEYFAVNSPAGIVGKTAQAAVTTISGWGFPVTAAQMTSLAHSVGEVTLFNRTGGAPSFALGMAHIFARSGGSDRMLAFSREPAGCRVRSARPW